VSSQGKEKRVQRWELFELELTGLEVGNPYLDVQVQAVFRFHQRSVKVDGFYDGGSSYRVRFMPDATGEWTYETHSNQAELDGVAGTFTCIEPEANNHGPVRIRNDIKFAYEDGTPYYPFGTTCYAWIHQEQALQEQTLRTLEESPFNKIRMCVFPKNYSFNFDEPEHFPFAGSAASGFDFTRFNPAFFANLEARLMGLLELGIEADLILFHPYDKGRWGFDRLDARTEEFYLRYVIARLGAFRHVWWSLANEYDFMAEKAMPDWDRLLRYVQDHDPYVHLRSIHNGTKMYDYASVKMYDHAKPWVTHCSIQHWDATMASIWRDQYKKPIVIDEICYEGNIPQRWGNISGEEMTRRFWDGVTRGAYVTHGETFVHPQDEIWWAKGGRLYGESAKRIAFLRELIEAAPAACRPIPEVRDVPAFGVPGQYYLHYYGIHQPLYRIVDLPEGETFRAEIIDTWNMEITPIEQPMSGTCRVDMPGKPYIALRIERI
jgi:hypothetical protein